MKAAIRRLTCKIEFVPVLCGSAFKKRGVQSLVDAVVDYLPSPLDVPPPIGLVPGTEDKVEVRSDDSGKFCSLAFKLWTDPYVGKLVFFRVYSGRLSKGDIIYNPRTRKRERVNRVMMIQADKRIDVDDNLLRRYRRTGRRGETSPPGIRCCNEDFEVLLDRHVPRTGHLDGRRAENQGRPREAGRGLATVGRGGSRPSAASPTRKPGQLIIAGMGELHLEIIRDRLFREFKVSANAGAPQIAYRETVTKAAEGEGKFIRQSGGRGQYGHASLPWLRMNGAKALRSRTRSSAARSPRNTFRR